jgi:hypothetical protein
MQPDICAPRGAQADPLVKVKGSEKNDSCVLSRLTDLRPFGKQFASIREIRVKAFAFWCPCLKSVSIWVDLGSSAVKAVPAGRVAPSWASVVALWIHGRISSADWRRLTQIFPA